MALNDEKQCYLENPLDTEQLTVVMENFLAGSPLNQVPELGVERMFARPLVGVALADDALFERLKEPEIIGPRHLLPRVATGSTICHLLFPTFYRSCPASKLQPRSAGN